MMKVATIIFAVIMSAVSTATAQVSVPFEVPLPAWLNLVTAKSADYGLRISQKPNASSDDLVYVSADGGFYRWKSPSMFLAQNEKRYTVGIWDFLPLKSADGPWAGVEFFDGGETIDGWIPAYGLRKVVTYALSGKDMTTSQDMVAWTVGDETYAVVEGGGEHGFTIFYVGKLKDGYVVCPYECLVEWNLNSKHPGILNGKLGAEGGNLSKFMLKDVEYILAHSTPIANGKLCRVGVGIVDSGGDKRITWITTSLVRKTAPVDDNVIYKEVDELPSYPGGTRGLSAAVARAVRYPLIAVENNVQGVVKVRFVVEKDGTMTNHEVTQSVSMELDREALRAVKTITRMSSPGKIKGVPVRTYFTLPVTFRLN